MENIIEQYQERIEHEFNALCKIIIRHASAEAKSKVSKRWKREISFEYLVESGVIPAYSCGGFENGIEARHPLSLCGHTVILENERLSKALSLLERKKQEIVFLYFFKHYTYQEIAGYYGQAHSSVWSRMQTVMKQLKKRNGETGMKGKNLISYGTIVKAANGDPGAIETVLEHYSGYIRYFSKMDGYVNTDVENHVRERLIDGILKFRFDKE